MTLLHVPLKTANTRKLVALERARFNLTFKIVALSAYILIPSMRLAEGSAVAVSALVLFLPMWNAEADTFAFPA
jgi:hypothetical protein